MSAIHIGVTCTLIDGTCLAGETVNKYFTLNEGVESVLVSLLSKA